MTAHEASSSSSSKSELWSYDVFLSFSGEDTRYGFTGCLHQALKDKGYRVFIDEDGLKRGEEIRGELLGAIEESKISIIVFSKMYADSSWCLDELVKIMECRDKLGRHVLPIFYHVDPSHVRNQNGDLAEAFRKHEKDIHEETDDKKREAKQKRVKQWREALTEAGKLSGHHLKIANDRKRRREAHTEAINLSDHQTTGNGHEAEFIKKIVDENIWEWLLRTNELQVSKHPIGIKSRIQGIINDLSSGGSNDVLMVGIWGMGGLGKTTTAKAIYNQIHHMFEFKSFLADVRDTSSKHGLVYLQETLISDILKQKSQIESVDLGISMIQQVVQHRRVLIIIDDIDDRKQLDAIARSHDWFGPGSRIIMTTRNEHLLKQVEVDKTYPLREMKKEEALELFSWHAFQKSCPNEEYLEVSKKVVSYCGGLPLALEVLGSFLFKRPIEEWKSQLEKLERVPEGEIIKPLRISFEGLDDTKKASFLDISCFFIGEDKDYVTKILDGCGFSATVGISVLRERCLVTVEDNHLNMHDLLREMARVIISEKSLDCPGKWSRLWNHQEVTDVLTNKSGTQKIEGLALHFLHPSLSSICQNGETKIASFNTKAFAKMKKLRLLQLSYVELNGEYKHLPKELIWLCWRGFPLQSIPDDFFNQRRLVVLDMQESKLVQVWEGSKLMQKLKIIDLSFSYSLKESPDFSQVPNLEKLILECCPKLSEIHPSIGHLESLSLVNLRSCRELSSLPRDFYKSKSVQTLLLDGCSKFGELHEDIGEMISLRTLEVEETAIRQVPPSIVRLKNLTRSSLFGVQRLQQSGEALTQDANLSWNVREWLPSANELNVAKYLVGINNRVQDIISYLSGGSDDVVMVGIWGMGGLGKTTAAKAIYNQIHPMFEFKSFLADVSGATSKHGLVYLQEKLISDILKKKYEISSVHRGIDLIKQQFRHKKVLVIMDNIDKEEQLDAIAGNHDWFGPGSRIIITTRDERLLKQVDKTYPAQKLNEGEALELFSWHAFGNSFPNEGYLELSIRVISYCGGLPLALEVLGSFLFKRPIAEWKSQLMKLKRTPEGEIIKPLRISFEGLDYTQKTIFLDISCFFIGWKKDIVAKVLDGCGFFATIGICVLHERCLITVEHNRLKMHDLLQEMARVIISKKSLGYPGWNPQERTEEVEGLARPTTFLELNGEYKHLPKELNWLRWNRCPLQSLPDDFFNQPRLVGLDMQESNLVQVWEGSKSLHRLRIIDLTFSIDLRTSPDFSQVPNLEELVLEHCWSLSEIHPSIGHLKKLSLVNLKGCRKLRSLPRDFYNSKSVGVLLLDGCSKFREMHEDLGEMISLRILEAERTAIRQVPPSTVRLRNLARLSLQGVKSIHLPYSLHGLYSLCELDLSLCELADDAIPKDLGSLFSLHHLDLRENDLHTLPSLSGLSRLETLRLSGCRYLHTIPDLPTNLKFLVAVNCTTLETMPNFSEMSNMRELDVSDSPKLTEVPGLEKSLNSMTWIDMHGCPNLTADFRKNILQGWTSYGFGGIALHGNYVPDWFEFVNEGAKVSFDIPPTDDRNFEGLTLFCLFRICETISLPSFDMTVISNTKRTKLQALKTKGGAWDDNYEDGYLWQGQLSNNELNLQGGDKVDIHFGSSSDRDYVKMMRIGVNLVWDKLMKQNMHDLDDAIIDFNWDSDEEGPSHDNEGGPSHDVSDKLVCAK